MGKRTARLFYSGNRSADYNYCKLNMYQPCGMKKNPTIFKLHQSKILTILIKFALLLLLEDRTLNSRTKFSQTHSYTPGKCIPSMGDNTHFS